MTNIRLRSEPARSYVTSVLGSKGSDSDLYGVVCGLSWFAVGSAQRHANTGRLDLPDFPYVALDLHLGDRW